MATHYIGMMIDGQYGRFFGGMTDTEFQPIADKGLPAGFIAWHIEEGETGRRVEALKRRDVIRGIPGGVLRREPSGQVEYTTPHADAMTVLRRAWGHSEAYPFGKPPVEDGDE